MRTSASGCSRQAHGGDWPRPISSALDAAASRSWTVQLEEVATLVVPVRSAYSSGAADGEPDVATDPRENMDESLVGGSPEERAR
jgi:hypothetical protein